MAPNMLMRAKAPGSNATGTTVADAHWNGTIPKGMSVCDTSTEAVTVRTCAAHNGTTQFISNTTMCLLTGNLSDWGRWTADTQARYNITSTPPNAPLSISCRDSAGVRSPYGNAKSARALVFVLAVVAIAAAL